MLSLPVGHSLQPLLNRMPEQRRITHLEMLVPTFSALAIAKPGSRI